ncbi:MAG: TerB family tellurite resistance protein [Alphaproteobacteria bacterium]|nr:TerB family tellurite resistance protein [Alphaproteobacteria bacterium]
MTPEPQALAPDQLAPYFAVLAAMANADGRLSNEEIAEFRGQLDAHQVDADEARRLAAVLVAPPPLDHAIELLADSPARYSLFLDAHQIAMADGHFDDAEKALFADLQKRLRISDDEAKALLEFSDAARVMAEQGESASGTVKNAFKEAAANVAAVGVPVGAVAASGSVWGLSAAGITSGLAALGMGFGMVSGIGTCIALGFVSYRGVRWMLGGKS